MGRGRKTEISDDSGTQAAPGFFARHRALVIAAAIALVVSLPVVWYLASPLFIDKRVDESFPPVTATSSPAGSQPPASVAPAASPRALTSGELRGIDHRSSGTATIYQQPGGGSFVRLDHDTQNGPDLYVYLIGSPDYTKKADAADFVDLGRLKGNQGQQNYEIPADTDLAKYRTLMIWCKRFDVAFAAAPLQATPDGAKSQSPPAASGAVTP